MGTPLNMCKKWKLVCLSGLLGAGFYIADVCVDVYLFQEGKLIDQFLHPDPIELWMRFSVIFVALAFGTFAQIMVHRADAATNKARTAEKFLNSVIENIPNMIFIKDAEHLRFTRINKAGEDLLGHSRDVLVGKNDFDFFPHEQAEYFTGKDRHVLQSRAILDIPEEDIASRDGGKRILHTKKMPILDEQGNPAFLLGISEDITAQKQTRLDLLQAKASAEHYLQISQAMIVGLDAKGCITLINQRGCELLGRSENDLLGQNWFDIAIPDSERNNVGAVFQRIIAGEIAPVEYHENEIITAAGDSRYLLWHNTLRQGPAGEIIGTLSSGTDITARKHTENQLRLAGVVFKSSKQGVVVTDTNNRIISVNPAYTAITGYTQKEVIGKDPSYIKSGRHDEAFYQNLWDEIEKCGYWEGELWNRRKNGEAYPSWQSISAVFDSGHELAHYVSVFSDMTPIKKHQKELDFLAHHDPLTGLPNRLMFDDRLTHALQRCVREGTDLALLFMDLDDFKNINDTYGHAVGDYLLQTISTRLGALLRKEDTIARLGGDEFLILLESYESIAGVEGVAKKIISEISSPIEIDAHKIAVHASIGIAIGPLDGSNGSALMKAGDVAMYRAKADGPGNYRFSTRGA